VRSGQLASVQLLNIHRVNVEGLLSGLQGFAAASISDCTGDTHIVCYNAEIDIQ
jgi:hypothetical protein